MNIAVIGTGGVGGYFGGRVASAGFNVTFVARGSHFQEMKKTGLTVKSVKGNFKVNPVNVVEKIPDIKNPDLILIAVKAWQVKDVAVQLKEIITPQTIILPMQNGVLAYDEIIEFIPKKNVIKGLCRIFSKIEVPGVINHMSSEPTIIFGEVDNSKSERILQIKNVFETAGINNLNPDDIDVEIWKKFILICLSGFGAVTRTAHGPLRELPETREMMIEIMREVFEIGVAKGINLEAELVSNIMKGVDKMDYNATSSLTRDVMDGKPSEINYQNGTVVNLGKILNIKTPMNKFVYNCILPMENEARQNLN